MSDYKTQTGKSIDQAFEEYIRDNPAIYNYFVSFAIQWIRAGAKKISSKQIIGRIRWEVEVETKGDQAKEFKINDAFSSRISRKFIEDYPEYSERLEFRHLRS